VEHVRRYMAAASELRLMVYARISWKLFWIMREDRVWDMNRIDELIARSSEAQTGCPVTYTYTDRTLRELLDGYEVIDARKAHIFTWDFEASRRAEAMGLIEPAATPRDEATALRLLASRVRRAGIAAAAAERLDASGLHNVEVPDPAEIVPLLETLIAALEASPVPKFEWTGLGRIFAPDDLAALMNVSLSSLKRYVSGERETPDDVAA